MRRHVWLAAGAYGPCADESRRRFSPRPEPNVAKAAGMMGLTAEMLARMPVSAVKCRMPLPRDRTLVPGRHAVGRI